jgi:hypothetical protein
VCLDDGNDGTCVTEGTAIFDVFTVSAENWADADGGLQYRFGYQVAGEALSTWFDWSEANLVDLRLPTGSVTIAMQARDSLYATSEIMTSTVEIGGGRRRLLSSFDWNQARALLTENLNGGNLDELNNNAASMIDEAKNQHSAGTLDTADSLVQKEMIFTHLEQAAQVKHGAHQMAQGYACAALALTQSISANKDHLNETIVDRMLDHAGVLINDAHGTVDSLTNCAGAAMAVLSQLVAASANASTSLFDRFHTAQRAVLTETAAGLINGQSVGSASSSNAFGSSNWERDSLANGVAYAMPDVFRTGAILDFNEDVSVLLAAQLAPPVFDGVAPAGPLVSILVAQGGAEVPVVDLADPINISIPFTPAHIATGKAGRCVFINGSTLSDSGVTTLSAGASGVTCQTSHLTTFTVVPVEGESAPADGIADGIVAVGDTTTTAPATTTTTPTPELETVIVTEPGFAIFVAMAVKLPFTLAEFTAAKMTAFRRGVAAAADVDLSSVVITGVREVDGRRAAGRTLLAAAV